MDEDFSRQTRSFRSHTDVWQGKSAQYAGKKTGQTAFNGCEYRFLAPLRQPKTGRAAQDENPP